MRYPFDLKFEKYNLGKNPGLAAMVIKRGEVIFKKGYGLSNLETCEKITSKTNFDLASVSKQFTAMAIAMLEEQGKIATDEVITEYFSDFPPHMQEVKVSHLIYHLSGIPQYYDEFCSTNPDKVLVTNDNIYDFYKSSGRLDFKPGNRFEYSNGGYSLLAKLVEQVSGLPFSDFIWQHIFEPLGMTNSRVVNPQEEIANKAACYSAWPYFENIEYNTCNALYGEGGIYSSLDDTQAWINAFENNVLVSPETKLKMLTPAISNQGDQLDYAYGWVIEEIYKHKMVFHDGGWQGFSTLIANFPDNDLWFVVYANTQAISAWDAMEEIAKHYLKLKGV